MTARHVTIFNCTITALFLNRQTKSADYDCHVSISRITVQFYELRRHKNCMLLVRLENAFHSATEFFVLHGITICNKKFK